MRMSFRGRNISALPQNEVGISSTEYIVYHKYGEWFWKISRDRIPSNDKYKVDPWKCPYHNSRTCFEVMARLGAGSHAISHS